MGLVRDSDGVRGARVNRNKSFLLGSAGNKVKRSNSVLPGFLGRRPVQENRTVVEVGGGGGGPQQFPWVQQEKAKESASNVSDNHNNNNNGNNNNGKNNNNRYVEHACQHGFGVRDRPCLGETGNLQSAVLNLPSARYVECRFWSLLSNTGSRRRSPPDLQIILPKMASRLAVARSSADIIGCVSGNGAPGVICSYTNIRSCLWLVLRAKYNQPTNTSCGNILPGIPPETTTINYLASSAIHSLQKALPGSRA